MSATGVDLQTILRAAFDRLAIDPSQPDQWSIAGETACLRAMQHAYDLGLDDGKMLASIQDKAAALSASPQDGWKTIDSAPKDGTGILAYVDGFGMGQFVLFWLDGYWREGASLMGLKTQPTHWQPLPAPPALPQPTGDGYTVTSGGSYEIGSGGEIPTDTITCLRCGQKMESKEAAQGCEDPCCPLT
jgi:hypothetical protein